MNAIDLTPLRAMLAQLGTISPDSLIPILQKIQCLYGYLPREAVLEASRLTGIPAGRMWGVATFYSQFHLHPRGRHTIKACCGTACHVRGSQGVIEAVGKELGIEAGQTTSDQKFTLETVACLGTCFLAPALMIDDEYYGNMSPKSVVQTLKVCEAKP